MRAWQRIAPHRPTRVTLDEVYESELVRPLPLILLISFLFKTSQVRMP